MKKTEKEFIEKGADLEHQRWSDWHRYSRLMATPKNIERWDRQAETPYIALSEKEQESDRKEVRKYLPLIKSLLLQEVLKMVLKSLPRETPEFDNFSDEIEWQEKNRGTDSQWYNEGYDTCLSQIKQIIKKITS